MKTMTTLSSILALWLFSVGTAQALTPNEQLGKSIFFDETLSVNANQSCAACHDPEAGWTGPAMEINATGGVYEGSIPGRFGNRKPPSSAYATQSPIFHFLAPQELFIGGNFWDGRATGEVLGNPAADQAKGPFLNPLEQALDTPGDVVDRICTGAYAGLFMEVAGTSACAPENVDMAFNSVALSVAAYEGSPEVNAFSSKYDAVLAAGGKVKLSRQEKKGRSLFRGKAKCSRCHTLSGKAPLFTDFTFDNLGTPRNPENPFYLQTDFNPDGEAWVDYGLGGFLETRDDYADMAEENDGKQKVPTLRNVDKRPYPDFVKAYGHNGYFKSLKGIVHFYNTRDVKPSCESMNVFDATEVVARANDCWPEPEVAENVNDTELGDLGLSGEEEDAIVAFMKTLTDGYVAPTP